MVRKGKKYHLLVTFGNNFALWISAFTLNGREREGRGGGGGGGSVFFSEILWPFCHSL